MTEKRGERGLALIVVLWGISALALIAGAMLAASMTAAHIEHNAWIGLQVETDADAGVQGAILSLFDSDPATRPPLDGRVHDIAFGDATIAVTIQDEFGRIDLNTAGRGLLRDYFKSAGLEATAADALAGRIVERRMPANGDGGRQGHGLFQSVDQLRVLGVTPDLFRRIAPGLTVFSHRPNFDMRVATPEVLQVIPGFDRQKADLAIAARRPTVAVIGHAFEITATAERGDVRAARRAVVLLTGDATRPYWILDWK